MRLNTALHLWAALTAAVVITNASVPSRMDLRLLQKVITNKSKNEAISPFLLSNALSQVWVGARGPTRNEIGQVLGLSSSSQLSGYRTARRALSSSSSASTALFNRLYVLQGFSVKPTFQAIIRGIFGTDAQKISSIPAAVQAINTDVSKVTRNRIKKLVTEGDLRNAVLVLVGALYFKGAWEQTFTAVGARPFFTTSGTRTVDMMKLEKRLPYRSFRGFDAVSLPYDDRDYCLMIIRPSQRSHASVNGLHSRLPHLNIDRIYRQLRTSIRKVIVTMPKFKIDAEYKLKPSLQALGINKLFTFAADLSGIGKGPLRVSKVIHKVFMEVNEKGTEAAGAVAVVITKSASISTRFLVDRPFLAVLYHKSQQLTLFSAWVGSPQY